MLMRKPALIAATAAVVSLTACENMTREESMFAGGLGGAAAGILTAKALGGDSDWKIIGALAGAAAGSLVARNAASGQCAYARRDGTYRVAPC